MPETSERCQILAECRDEAVHRYNQTVTHEHGTMYDGSGVRFLSGKGILSRHPMTD